MFKNMFFVGGYQAFAYGSTFLRGIILARILGPNDYGLALILLAITAGLDLFADAGIDRFVVQNRFAHRSDLMRTAHAFRVGGSSLVGLSIVLLSYPVAMAFDAPELWLPIALTGGIVSIRGLVNLSYKLQQRDHRFGREATIHSTVYAVELVATTLVALWTKSYWAVLVGAYLSAITHVVLSHALAKGGYSFVPRGRLLGLVSRFSTPIYLNAFLLFAAAQGDRIVIAASFSKQDLAFYATASAIGAGITSLVGAMTMSIMLPKFAARGGGAGLSRLQMNQLTGAVIAASVVFALGLSLFGPPVVGILYGPAFAGLGILVIAASVVQMIQLEQGWLTTLLMANGLTSRFPLITIMRASAFPAALVMVHFGMSILAVPIAFALGATLSLAVSYHAVNHLRLISGKLITLSFTRIALMLCVTLLLERNLPLP